jgi:ATP-binding protein involved in chromosome partitioning
VLVTIPSEVSRGVVARSVAALSKGPNRLLGYVENMSGYFCRDCKAVKPLFVSPSAEPAGLEIPCLGTVPFDPELARHCDRGLPLADLPETPVGRALEHVAQQLLDSLEPALPASAHDSRELRLGKEPSR